VTKISLRKQALAWQLEREIVDQLEMEQLPAQTL